MIIVAFLLLSVSTLRDIAFRSALRRAMPLMTKGEVDYVRRVRPNKALAFGSSPDEIILFLRNSTLVKIAASDTTAPGAWTECRVAYFHNKSHECYLVLTEDIGRFYSF